MKSKASDFVVALIAVVFGTTTYMMARKIPLLMENDVGSAFFPKVIALSLLILGILKFIVTLLRKGEEKAQEKNSDMVNGMKTIVLLLGYVILFGKLGFILSSMVYLFLQMLILSKKEERRMKLFAFISILVPIVMYILFVFVIKMPLPKGILPI